MALKNKITNEYLKVDFGKFSPVIKIFRNQETRVLFNPTFDKFRIYPLSIDTIISLLNVTPNMNLTVIDNIKTNIYNYLSSELNKPIKSFDENGNEVLTENIIWENC